MRNLRMFLRVSNRVRKRRYFEIVHFVYLIWGKNVQTRSSGITSVLSERRNQSADERRSEVKFQTLSVTYSATSRPVGLLRFGSTHCYTPVVFTGSWFNQSAGWHLGLAHWICRSIPRPRYHTF